MTGKTMTLGSEKLEHQLRSVEYCTMKPEYPDDSMRANFNLALRAARMLKRQRKEIESLIAQQIIEEMEGPKP